MQAQLSPVEENQDHAARDNASQSQIWTCSMHPQIRQPNPGKCPICAMELIPVAETNSEIGFRELVLSESARKLAAVETVPVEKKTVQKEIRMVGTITYDETRLAYITARFPGRLDRLYVDYTGISVKKGDHLVSMYSPEILTAEEELIQAIQGMDTLGREGVSSIMREATLATIESAREKLRLWGLREEQVQAIERSKKPADHSRQMDKSNASGNYQRSTRNL